MSDTSARAIVDDIEKKAAAHGVLDLFRREIAQLRHALQPERRLTTGEAAELLGLRSINTVKMLIAKGTLRGERVGSHWRIPLSEVERAQEADDVRLIRHLDKLHDEIEDFGRDMTEEEMEELHQSRPGTYPWER